MDPRAYVAATGLGLASGMRTLTPLAALGLTRGRRLGARLPLTLGAVGELAFDKTPWAGERTAPPILAGRVLAGAVGGGMAARASGRPLTALALTGALAAWVSSVVFHRLRARAARRSVFGAAVAEDLLAAGVASASLLFLPSPRRRRWSARRRR